MKTAHLALPAHLAASLSALSSFSRAQGMGLKGDEDWELKIETTTTTYYNKQYLKSASDKFELE